MSRRLWRWVATIAFVGSRLYVMGQTAPVELGQPGACADLEPGLVVESAGKYSEGGKAGLTEGDVVHSWVQGDRRAALSSPFDLTAAEIEIAPRGAVTLEGNRGTAKLSWVLGPDKWGIEVRPNFAGDLLPAYREGRELAKAGKALEAVQRWIAAAAVAGMRRCAWPSVWLLFHGAETLAGNRQWEAADSNYREALARAAGMPMIEAQLRRAWAATFLRRSEWDGATENYRAAVAEATGPDSELALAEGLTGLGRVAQSRDDRAKAEDYYRQALAIRERVAPGSLAVASSLNDIGQTTFDMGKAEEYYRRALAIREEKAPGGLGVAASLLNLGLLDYYRGDSDKAVEYYRRALVIDEKLASGTINMAADFNNLGLVEEDLGNLDQSEAYYRQALEIVEKLEPESVKVARTLNNLANVISNRGDMVTAEQYHRRALAIFRKLVPDTPLVAASLHNLGDIAMDRGDLATAEEYHLQALAIREKADPGGLAVAFSLTSLGNIAFAAEDLAKAEDYHRRSLAIREKESPGGLRAAATLDDLGSVLYERGDLVKAKEYFQRALAIFEKLAPGSINMAATANGMGDVARRSGDLRAAETYYRQALEIRKRLAPRSTDAAESLAALAAVMREKGQPDAAGDLFAEALDALEGQAARLGGSSDVRSGFRAKHAAYYRDYMDLLMSRHRPDLAFEVLERSRARTLLELLSEARVDVRQGADPLLLEQERLLRATIRAKTGRRLEAAESGNEPQSAATNREIDGLLVQYGEIQGRIRSSSPGYAALTQPQPLTAKTVQERLLDPGTVLLEYALGTERSYVFVVTQTTLEAYVLPKREEIETAARRVYSLLTAPDRPLAGASGRPAAARLADSESAYWAAAASLSRMVIGPATARIEGKRLLIAADGVLQYIPFGALPVPTSGPDSGQQASSHPNPPLLAGHEIIYLPSASVLEAIRRERSPREAEPRKMVAVIADPVFDKDDPRVLRPNDGARPAAAESLSKPALALEDRPSRRAAGMGLRTENGSFSLARLAFSRREAAAIMALTPPGLGLEAVDFQASRETATGPQLADYRIVHFATHGVLDSRHPELSGLVLSMVDEKGNPRDGFLSLDDVYNLNLPADLVVLSACETGLGKVIDGEGLVGLTSGFIYAGARRVMASLWKVDDVATAELMESFYRGVLQRGMTPAAALRQAQLQMWKQKRWAAPNHWGAFTLQGEW